MLRYKDSNEGFSLVELIIVIAIMAVLVAIIAPNLTKYLGKSKDSVDKKNLDEIKSQVTTCIADSVPDGVDIITGEDGVKSAYYYAFYDTSQSKTVVTPGLNGDSNFAKSAEEVFTHTQVKSKKNSKFDKVEICISGQASSGYSVNVKYTS